MKRLFTLLAFMLIVSISSRAEDKPKEISFAEYYDVLPDVANCKPGVLKQSVIDRVLERVNQIRSLHKLKPVTYETLGQVMSMEGCLNMVASGQGGHIDNPSTPCYTPGAGAARMKSNIEYGGAGNTPEGSIIGWMIDDRNADQANEYKVGHRRAIINPFLTRFAYGKSDGIPKSGGGEFHAANFLYQDFTNGDISDTQLDFVAYPYEYYPPSYFNKSFYMSFNAIANRTDLWQNQKVSFASTTVEMTDESGNKINVHSVLNDNEGWGSFPNNLSWKADGLTDEVKYNVSIKNVLVNGTNKNYAYWFKLTNLNHTQPPTAPTLVTPGNLATGVRLNNSFSWALTPNTSKFHIQVSENAEFTKLVIDKSNLPLNSYVATELDYESNYWWRVASINDAGKSGWSQVFTFKTTSPTPDKPYLAGPANNTVINTTTPTLFWTRVPGAETYSLQISKDDTFEGFSIRYTKSSLTDTFHIVPVGRINNETDYWWRVKCVNAGGESVYTPSWKFNTGVPLPAPTIVGPAEGTETTLTPTLSWNVVPGATTYNLQLADRVGFDQGYIINELKWDGVSYNVPKDLLKDGKTYYWRVKANSGSGSGPFSGIMSFTAKGGTSVTDYKNDKSLSVYPNPMSSSATINYLLDTPGIVRITMIDELGKEIMDIISEYREAGLCYEFLDLNRTNIPSGIYFIKLQTQNSISVNKIILMK
jgi:hypothetical protein